MKRPKSKDANDYMNNKYVGSNKSGRKFDKDGKLIPNFKFDTNYKKKKEK